MANSKKPVIPLQVETQEIKDKYIAAAGQNLKPYLVEQLEQSNVGAAATLLDLDLDAITVDNALNPREGALDQDVIEDYAAHIDELPPMTAARFQGESPLYLIKGFHRYAAHRRARRAAGRFIILDDLDRSAGRLEAGLDNLRNGLRLSRREHRGVIGDALRLYPGWSNVRLAELCHTTDKTVGSVREELEGRAEIVVMEMLEDAAGVMRPRSVAKAEPAPTVSADSWFGGGAIDPAQRLARATMEIAGEWQRATVEALGHEPIDDPVLDLICPECGCLKLRGAGAGAILCGGCGEVWAGVEAVRAALEVYSDSMEGSYERTAERQAATEPTPANDGGEYVSVRELESAVRAWLRKWIASGDEQIELLQRIKDRTPASQRQLDSLVDGDVLPAPRRKADVIRAINNILDQMRQSDAEANKVDRQLLERARAISGAPTHPAAVYRDDAAVTERKRDPGPETINNLSDLDAGHPTQAEVPLPEWGLVISIHPRIGTCQIAIMAEGPPHEQVDVGFGRLLESINGLLLRHVPAAQLAAWMGRELAEVEALKGGVN